MITEQLQRAFDGIWSGSSDRNWIPGLVGSVDGAGGYRVQVTGQPGYLHVTVGVNGEQGPNIALNAAGAAAVAGTPIKMRRENGELVIREATAYAAGSGGPGGATTLDQLTDVTLTSPAAGQTLQYNAGTGQWINVVPPGGAGGAPSPHDLSGPHHSGLLDWGKINFNGSSLLSLQNRSHNLLTGIGPDDHHPRGHDIISGDGSGPVHTIVAPEAWSLVGTNAPHTLAVLTSSDNPVAGSMKFLRTSADGSFRFDNGLMAVDPAAHRVTWDVDLMAVNAAQDTVRFRGDTLYLDLNNRRVGINLDPNVLADPGARGAALDIRAANLSDHSQRIRQVAGQEGRLWRIEDLEGRELIVLDSVGNLQSGRPGFVSGLTGWQITPNGNAEFNNIWARGELHATVFVKDEVHAIGGTLLVASAANLHEDATFNSAPTQSYTLALKKNGVVGHLRVRKDGQNGLMNVTTLVKPRYGIRVKKNGVIGRLLVKHNGTDARLVMISSVHVLDVNDPLSGAAQYFQRGEVIRSKTEVPTGVTDYWFRINSFVQMDGFGRYGVERLKGSDGTLPKGSGLVSYGFEGDGRILMTSDWRRDEGYAPYIDVFTVGKEVWEQTEGSVIPRMRMGQLKGVGLPGVSGISQWGMVVSTDLSNANAPYFIASDLQISMFRVPFKMNNGLSDTVSLTPDGEMKLGTNIGQVATTGFFFDPTNGNLLIGRKDRQFMEWDQGNGRLTINGDLIIGDGGFTTKKYVDDQDEDYDELAQGYGNNALTNSQQYTRDYGNARRIEGVSGSWDSPSRTVVTWESVQVRLASGKTISVIDGNTGNMLGRMYLYVLVDGATTQNMGGTYNLNAIGPDVALVAVADPGIVPTPPDLGSDRASVSIVGGSTYISGDNIITGSIVAKSIAASAITGDKIAGQTIVSGNIGPGQILSGNIGGGEVKNGNIADLAVNTGKLADLAVNNGKLANGAVTNGKIFDYTIEWLKVSPGFVAVLGGKRIQAVAGSMTPSAGQMVTWDGLHIMNGNGGIIPITDGFKAISERTYFVIPNNATGAGATLVPYGFSEGIPPEMMVIAVAEPGETTGVPSVTITAGGTIISGDSIITGTVTADKININDRINLSANGIISTDMKNYGTGAGIFLGYDGGTYKFDLTGTGPINSYLRFDKNALVIQAVELRVYDPNLGTPPVPAPLMMDFSGNIPGVGSASQQWTLGYEAGTGTLLDISTSLRAQINLLANKVINKGNTLQIAQQRQPPPNEASALAGEICWHVDGFNRSYLYLCYAPGQWRRVEVAESSWTMP